VKARRNHCVPVKNKSTEVRSGRPQFAAIPCRVLDNARLTASHWRLLAAVCYHDRLSLSRGKGQGCWACHGTLAKKANVHYSNVSTLVGDFLAWGILTREPFPGDGRRHVYRVVYDSLPNGNTPSIDVEPPQKLRVEKNFSQSHQQDEQGEYISQKRSKIYPAEAAPLLSSGAGPGKGITSTDSATLALIVQAMKDGGHLDPCTRAVVLDILTRANSGALESRQAKAILDMADQTPPASQVSRGNPY